MKKVQQVVTSWKRKAWLAAHKSVLAKPDDRGRPRLLVDLSVIARHDARTGIQRVVRAIWTELHRRAHPRYDFVPIYASASRGYCYARLDDGRLQRTKEVVRCRPGDKFLGLDLSAHYLPHWVEQLSAWREAGATIHSVVYDLLPLRSPAWFTPATRAHFPRWFETVTKYSDQLLCISDTVARDVEDAISPATQPRVGRLFLSGNIADSDPSGGISDEIAAVLRDAARRPTVLMVGTVEPRKGHDSVLAAFDTLWRTQPDSAPDLLIVGKPGWRTDGLQQRLRHHPLRGSRLHWFDAVSDEALTALYDACCAVLVASRGEGFGLPLAEAAYHKRWVLARDLPVFREQHLPNCLFFDDDTPSALAERILDLAEHARGHTPPQSALPGWTDCLEKLLVTIGIEPERLEAVSGKIVRFDNECASISNVHQRGSASR